MSYLLPGVWGDFGVSGVIVIFFDIVTSLCGELVAEAMASPRLKFGPKNFSPGVLASAAKSLPEVSEVLELLIKLGVGVEVADNWLPMLLLLCFFLYDWTKAFGDNCKGVLGADVAGSLFSGLNSGSSANCWSKLTSSKTLSISSLVETFSEVNVLEVLSFNLELQDDDDADDNDDDDNDDDDDDDNEECEDSLPSCSFMVASNFLFRALPSWAGVGAKMNFCS